MELYIKMCCYPLQYIIKDRVGDNWEPQNIQCKLLTPTEDCLGLRVGIVHWLNERSPKLSVLQLLMTGSFITLAWCYQVLTILVQIQLIAVCLRSTNNSIIPPHLQVFVMKKNRSVPIITAVISMPISESMVVVQNLSILRIFHLVLAFELLLNGHTAHHRVHHTLEYHNCQWSQRKRKHQFLKHLPSL